MTEAPRRPAGPHGVGFGRSPVDSFAQRRLAAERRLSSSLRVTEMVEGALAAMDEELADLDVADPDGSLRATVRAALMVAHRVPRYDVAIAPARGRVAVRVTHTEAGLEAHVIELGVRRAQPRTPAGAPDGA
jgi:hypothetical protein